MKEFWYDNLDDYLEMADQHDNSKTVKMFEMTDSGFGGKKSLSAVTYLRTNMIGWQTLVPCQEMNYYIEKLRNHKHKQGVIVEGGRLL